MFNLFKKKKVKLKPRCTCVYESYAPYDVLVSQCNPCKERYRFEERQFYYLKKVIEATSKYTGMLSETWTQEAYAEARHDILLAIKNFPPELLSEDNES